LNPNLRALIFAGSLLASCFFLAAVVPGHASAAGPYAYYTRVESGEPMERFARVDEYADIVVKLDEPNGWLVFCRATGYLPY
jgi:hypothetical protein